MIVSMIAKGGCPRLVYPGIEQVRGEATADARIHRGRSI